MLVNVFLGDVCGTAFRPDLLGQAVLEPHCVGPHSLDTLSHCWNKERWADVFFIILRQLGPPRVAKHHAGLGGSRAIPSHPEADHVEAARTALHVTNKGRKSRVVHHQGTRGLFDQLAPRKVKLLDRTEYAYAPRTMASSLGFCCLHLTRPATKKPPLHKRPCKAGRSGL